MFPFVKSKIVCFGIFLLLRVEMSRQQEEDIPHIEVKNWALKFGVDLWEFGKQVTKMGEIQRKYHNMDAQVDKKDGVVLVRELASEVKNMMDFKINAVMRLMDSAEQAAMSTPPRDGSAATRYYAYNRMSVYSEDGKLTREGATDAPHMTPNRHFDHLAINASLSAVLFPSGVSETDPQVQAGIQWSDNLDPLFINNNENDPTLSWQYYGATSGFLRRFPATNWPPRDSSSAGKDKEGHSRALYEFRVSNWFIGAATSPKDLMVLIDAASFASEKTRTLASATARAILDTLGPDDYVNVYRYSESAEEIVRCFKDSLVQASPENLKELKGALHTIRPDAAVSNISAAFTSAFEILHRYSRTGLGSQCNQAIMLVTSNNEDAPKDVIKRYNWPHMPVRIFTYLVGGDKSAELYDTACTNKGFYSRITNTEEIKSKVLEYIKVLSRPMVLYQNDHPIHWSPVYVGGKSSGYGGETRRQLMTSVTAPILDHRNHTVKTANLLGIVGTDVKIEEIQKLVPPYRLGVNGYSFIVDNNGRVLYHPDLRPLPGDIDYEETLKPRYMSVDLSEVELAKFDESSHPLNNSFLLDLRRDMIDQKEGETDFAVKIHYDDMRRVTIRSHKYFYKPIEGTPFSLGLALPEGYGMYELTAEQEIKHAIVNVTDYFKGKNWKVHPDWTYCEYNSVSDKWFATPEERVLHFLTRTRGPAWKWKSLRPRSPSSHQSQASKAETDAYYCDKKLMQSLVLDALVTDGFDKKDNNLHREEKPSKGKGRFDVARSFIATRSGLLRWHDHEGQEIVDESNFAESNQRAMDSSWYKRAVDQHAIEHDSFVFSVPFNAADNPKTLVTATHAIFIENKGHKAPAAVVGIQYHHSSLASHFLNVTSTCTGCKKNCASEELDCYILDNNGFIIISERHEHTGKFFGEIDGTIMDSLVQDRIYRKVTVVDYQGVCPPQESHLSSAPRVITNFVVNGILSLSTVFWKLVFQLQLEELWRPGWVFATVVGVGDDHDDRDEDELKLPPNFTSDDDPLDSSVDSGEVEDQEEDATLGPNTGIPAAVPGLSAPPTTRTTSIHYPPHKLRSCEKKTDLYILQPDRLNTSGQGSPLKGKLTNCHVTGCERPFSVQKIRHTNLILLVVDTLCPCGSKQLSIEPMEAIMEPGACTARRERLYRRRPPKCINYHPEELEIKVCGGATGNAARGATVALALALALALLNFT